LRSRLNALRSR